VIIKFIKNNLTWIFAQELAKLIAYVMAWRSLSKHSAGSIFYFLITTPKKRTKKILN